MIAILIAASRVPAVYELDDHLPLALFPLADRPILHHIVDRLVAQGVRRFEFLLGHLPEQVEKYFLDGARWGCTFHYHLAPSESNHLQMAETIASGIDDDIVLGRGDRLPEFQLAPTALPTLFMTRSGAWTRWSVLPRNQRPFAQLEQYASGRSAVPALFDKVVVEHEVSFENATRLLQSQHDILSETLSACAISVPATRPGIWISRNVSIHHTAQLQAPVYIGPNCKIEQGARIGPSAVIGEGCIVDEQSSVVNTLVAPGTYIGQGLELDQVIVYRNRLVNARIDTGFLVSESFLLSGLARQKKPGLPQRFASSVIALALFTLFAPIALATLAFLWMRREGAFTREQAVRIPAIDDPRSWQVVDYPLFRLEAPEQAGWWTEFAAEVWPALFSVARGKLFLVGVKARAPREVEELPSDWKAIYLSSKAGLVSEASVMFGKGPSEDELYTAEAYYSATASLRHDLRLLRLYLRRLLSFNQQMQIDFSKSSGLNSSLEKVAEP